MTRLSCTSGATLESQVVPVLGAQRTDVWEWRGHKIRYGSAGKMDGNDPSIVMLHGFGSSADTWRNQYQELSAAGFRVFGVDLLGFGLSDKPKGTTYSIDLWAEMVHDFIKDVAGGHAVLMGNSIGSLVSCTVARDQPEAARGLVLCNCAAGMNSSFLVTSERTSPTGKIIFGAVFGLLKALLSLELFASWVFGKVKSRETVSNVLKNVYVNKDSVDADLVKVRVRERAESTTSISSSNACVCACALMIVFFLNGTRVTCSRDKRRAAPRTHMQKPIP